MPLCFQDSYATDDGERQGTCQDWETERHLLQLSRHYGEQAH